MERWFKDVYNPNKEVYNPNKEVAVDEAMIKFDGCSSLKQYMPMKRGIKVWCLADSLNGFFSSFQSTRGKKTTVLRRVWVDMWSRILSKT